MTLKIPAWLSAYATRFMPFADAASPDLPLGRLLRLSMFQLVIGMITALLVGTLNRVMIVELHVPAWWVALAVAIPMVFAPLRTLIGYRSDTHPSALGLRRIPYLWTGSLLLFGGLSVMPFALLLLAEAVPETLWLGQLGAGLSFILIGTGLQVTQTAGMALAIAVFIWSLALGAGDVWGYTVICALSGLALGADLIAPGALLNGVLQTEDQQHPHAGAYFGWWQVATKLNLALAAGVALPLLEWLGYTPGAQDAPALAALSWSYALLPCALKCLALLLLLNASRVSLK